MTTGPALERGEITPTQNPFIEFVPPALNEEQESAWNHFITHDFMSEGERVGPLVALIEDTTRQWEIRIRTMQFLLEPSKERYKNNMNLITLTPFVTNNQDTRLWVSSIPRDLAPYAAYQIADYIPTIERELSEETNSDSSEVRERKKIRFQALATYNAIIPILLPKLTRVQAGALFQYFDSDVMHRYISWDTLLENIIKSNADIIWKRKALARVHEFIKSQKPAYVSQPDYERQQGRWVKSEEKLQRHFEYHVQETKFRENILENYKILVLRSLTEIEGMEFPMDPKLFQKAIVFLLDIDKQHKPILHDESLVKAYTRLSDRRIRRAFARREFLGGKHTEPNDYCEHKDWGIDYITNADLAAFTSMVLADFHGDPDFAYLRKKLNDWEKTRAERAASDERDQEIRQRAYERMKKP